MKRRASSPRLMADTCPGTAFAASDAVHRRPRCCCLPRRHARLSRYLRYNDRGTYVAHRPTRISGAGSCNGGCLLEPWHPRHDFLEGAVAARDPVEGLTSFCGLRPLGLCCRSGLLAPTIPSWRDAERETGVCLPTRGGIASTCIAGERTRPTWMTSRPCSSRCLSRRSSMLAVALLSSGVIKADGKRTVRYRSSRRWSRACGSAAAIAGAQRGYAWSSASVIAF